LQLSPQPRGSSE